MVTKEYFKGLADPVRRSILGFLGQQPMNVTHLVACFNVSRPAISRHLRVLRQTGLVSETKVGRERTYRVEREALVAAAEWLKELAVGDRGLIEVAAPVAEPETVAAEDSPGWRQW